MCISEKPSFKFEINYLYFLKFLIYLVSFLYLSILELEIKQNKPVIILIYDMLANNSYCFFAIITDSYCKCKNIF